MVILPSKIDEQSVLKKIVDSRKRIESVDFIMRIFKDYVSELPKCKIGNVLKFNNDQSMVDFEIAYQRLNRKKHYTKKINCIKWHLYPLILN